MNALCNKRMPVATILQARPSAVRSALPGMCTTARSRPIRTPSKDGANFISQESDSSAMTRTDGALADGTWLMGSSSSSTSRVSAYASSAPQATTPVSLGHLSALSDMKLKATIARSLGTDSGEMQKPGNNTAPSALRSTGHAGQWLAGQRLAGPLVPHTPKAI